MKTLVYHAGALGDFITILPSLVAYRKMHPESTLIFLGKKAHGDLGKAAGYFSEVFDVDSARFASLFYDHPSISINTFLAGFDEAITFAVSDSPIIDNLLNSKIKKVHQQPPFPSDKMPVIDYHLSLFPKALLTDEEKQPLISFNPSSAIRKKSHVVIHLGSGSKKKNWPLERFIELSLRLKSFKKEIAWILGPVESDVAISTDDPVIREPALIDLCQMLQSASLFIGNDSGVAHLAAACGCACVVLFKQSDPAVWAPRGKNVKIITAKKSDDVLLDDVMKAVHSVTNASKDA